MIAARIHRRGLLLAFVFSAMVVVLVQFVRVQTVAFHHVSLTTQVLETEQQVVSLNVTSEESKNARSRRKLKSKTSGRKKVEKNGKLSLWTQSLENVQNTGLVGGPEYDPKAEATEASLRIENQVGCGPLNVSDIWKVARFAPAVDKETDIVALTEPKKIEQLSESIRAQKSFKNVSSIPYNSIDDALGPAAYEAARRSKSGKSSALQYVRKKDYDYEEVKGVVAVFRNAIVAGPESIVTDCSVVYRPGGPSLDSPKWNLFRRHMNRPGGGYKWDSVVELDRAVLIASLWAEGYFHWIVECIPRIAMVRDFLLRNPDVKVIAYSPISSNLNLLYQMLGIEAERIVPYAKRVLFRVRTLVVPTATAAFRANTLAVQEVRREFRARTPEAVGIASEEPFESARVSTALGRKVRIVVHDRGKGNHRSFEQQRELESAIFKRFSRAEISVYISNRTAVKEMIALHYQADVVVGPHGAGLSNSLFMRKGSSMLEINIPDRRTDPSIICHEITARKLGLRYFYMSAISGQHWGVMQISVEDVLMKLEPIVRFHEEELRNLIEAEHHTKQ